MERRKNGKGKTDVGCKSKHSLILLTVVLIVMLLAIGLTGRSESAQESPKKPIVMRMGHVASTNNPYNDAVTFFAKKVEEKTGGAVKINVFPNALLGGDRDMLEAIQNGTVDMGYVSLAVFENINPVFTAMQLPFLIGSYKIGYKAATSPTAQKMLDTLEKQKVKGLAIVQNGMRVVGTNTRPVVTPADFKNMKFRTAEGNLMVSMIKGLGALPTPMPYPEIYLGLQMGVIDGQEQLAKTWVTDKFYEVIKNISFLEMYEWWAIITINNAKFKSLSADQQTALVKAAKETQEFMLNAVGKYDAEALQIFKAKGIKVVERDSIDKKAFYNQLKFIYDDYAKKDPLIKEMINTVNSIKE